MNCVCVSTGGKCVVGGLGCCGSEEDDGAAESFLGFDSVDGTYILSEDPVSVLLVLAGDKNENIVDRGFIPAPVSPSTIFSFLSQPICEHRV
jgi:hypothetical protein